MSDIVLDVQNLTTIFETPAGVVKAVDNVSFSLQKGRTLGLVGESGCGKSVTSLSILKLIQSPPGRIESGRILYRGDDLVPKSNREMRKIRGNKISMIFQEPMTSLNPVLKIGTQITEVILNHKDVSKKEAIERAVEVLKLVGIPAARKRMEEYPHQLSGGMRQRVMIAIALACEPDVLIADEPTTALDVTIQAQILDLLRSLQEKLGMSILLITHDLGVVAEMCSDVVVMYAGKIVEKAPVSEIFKNPQHPYTQGLLNSLPSAHRDRLHAIPGIVPNLLELPQGCRFQERCEYAMDVCKQNEPELKRTYPENDSHLYRCTLPAKGSS